MVTRLLSRRRDVEWIVVVKLFRPFVPWLRRELRGKKLELVKICRMAFSLAREREEARAARRAKRPLATVKTATTKKDETTTFTASRARDDVREIERFERDKSRWSIRLIEQPSYEELTREKLSYTPIPRST